MGRTTKYDDLFTRDKAAELWNDMYERPTQLYQFNMALRRDYAADYVFKNLETGARILDLGCGAGVLSEMLLERGYSVTAADISADMLELARKRLERFPEDRFRLVLADSQELPFEDAEFDIVLCLGVFGYIEYVDRAVDEIRRVLEPGGRFLMSVRNRTNVLLSNPYKLAQWSARQGARALGLTRLKNRLGRALPEAVPDADADRFHIQIYDRPANVIKGVSARGFVLETFDGFGYGPLSFSKRSLLSLDRSVAISNFLNRMSRKGRLLAPAIWIADVSMYVFEKPAAA